MKGYDDNTFLPENKINRAEAVKILLLGSGIQVEDFLEHTNTFSDVEQEHWFYKYVIKAKNLGIIKGNQDGLFLPNNEINLAETLKVALLANNIIIALNTPEKKPYLDVKTTSWFAPYFAYAYENQLLDQKKYEKVYPGTPVTRGELAEIIYRIQKIIEKEQENISYASFYASSLQGSETVSGEKYDENKLTGAHRDLAFGTKVEITNTLNQKSIIVKINDRGPQIKDRIVDLSKAAFEAISPLSKGVIPVTIQVLEEVSADLGANIIQESEDCVWPENKEEIKTDFFTNKDAGIFIELYANLRTVYAENEIIDISGKIKDETTAEITAFIKDENGEQTLFTVPVHDKNFIVQVDLGKAGEKQLVIIPGRSNSNYAASIQVLPLTCEKVLPNSDLSPPDDYRFSVEDNEVIFRWNLNEADVSRVSLIQGENQVIQYFSVKKRGWKINLKSFRNFSQGEFVIKVETAKSESGSIFGRTSSWQTGETKKFTAIDHHYDKYDKQKIEISDLKGQYGFGGEISFTGRTKVKIRHEAAIITPSGAIEMIPLTTESEITENQHGIKVIDINKKISWQYEPQEHGTYILEINDAGGVAVLNMPVYEIGDIPLIPDYVDIKSYEKEEKITDLNVHGLSIELLNLINQDRKAARLDNLEIDENLSYLAQFRSDDMSKNNYISHWDLNNKDVNDLRISYGIKTVIGENIAKETQVSYAHKGLMRSAIHRKNILDKHWTRVGFGFSKSTDDSIIVVELFSSSPIDQEDVKELREDLLDVINSQRKVFLVPNASLISLAQNWSEKMSEEKFFDFKDTTGVALSEEVRKAGVLQTIGTFIIGNTSFTDLQTSVLEHEEIFNERWRKLRVGITQDTDGIIKVTLLYSE